VRRRLLFLALTLGGVAVGVWVVTVHGQEWRSAVHAFLSQLLHRVV
jgi:hypothetical protein